MYENYRPLPLYNIDPPTWEMMIKQKIVDPEETPQQMLGRVVEILFASEESFGTPPDNIDELKEQYAQYMVDGYVIPGTPTLTNAGRHSESALSSCVVIPANLKNKVEAAEIIRSYYKQNMGSGFDFTPYDDPVELIIWLNNLSAEETATGSYDRYIGNMGSLHVSHPRILEFIDLKRGGESIPHFNISVDLSEDFMLAVSEGQQFTLTDGTLVDAQYLFNKIAENAWFNGDPGVLFLDRINADNPVPEIGRYVTTPPCGEMGLAEGETCQFGYLNLAKFIDNEGKVNYQVLAEATALTTRILDNAIEYSLKKFPTELTTNIANYKRKIGIGVCGLAELLLKAGYPYDSDEARILARDVLSFINYNSKLASVALSKERGPCTAMQDVVQNKYYSDFFLEKKYAGRPTNTVSASDWIQLADDIRVNGQLRNILTTALPPTGRASVILGVTSGIEPIFSIYSKPGQINEHIASFIRKAVPEKAERALEEALEKGSFQDIEYIPLNIRNLLKTATEINSLGHILMVGELAGITGVVDETASKTVNLPPAATVDDAKDIFMQAYKLGLKNISVYRDQTKQGQPKKL